MEAAAERERAKERDSEPDLVNHPPHYHFDNPEHEPINVIEAWDLGHRLSTAIAYIARCKRKGEKKKDLRKAIWYIQREIDKGGDE